MVQAPFNPLIWLNPDNSRRQAVIEVASPKGVTAVTRYSCYSPPQLLRKGISEVTQMKLNRLIAASIVGISLLTTSTSAFACEHESHSWSWFGWCSHTDKDREKDKDCDHHDRDHDRDRDRGHDCDHGGSTGGSSSGGSTSGGGSSSGGGSTVGPKG
jgi:uncharacterized membrane protein YgcG